MIKGIFSAGKYISVSAANMATPFINPNYNNPMQGMLRINSNDLQVFDGVNWIAINSSHASVGLTGEAEAILDWARQKRDEEVATIKLAETNPAIKSLLDEMNKYKNQIEMIKVLMKDEVKV
jgi:hypothetical protein